MPLALRPFSSKFTPGQVFFSVIFLLGLLPSQILATPTRAAPSIEVLYGAYEILGRMPGPNGLTYDGWIRIAFEGDTLSVDRCVAGNHSEAQGHLVSVTKDNIPAVEFRFSVNDQPLQATCAYLNDFNNLPRFSCITYPSDSLSSESLSNGNLTNENLTREVPGLESAFPIIWPVALDYFQCS